jgi:uncharacterized protein YgbK (DUF1537 family)
MLLDLPATWPGGVDVLAVDLNVREHSALEARDVVTRAARRLGSAARLFLKIDSTLRGPVSALVEGALEGSQAAGAIVAPAFPEHGRVYHGGHLRIGEQTSGLVLTDVLGTIGGRCSVHDDLAEAVAASMNAPERLLVGSGGLARRLAGPAQPLREHADAGPVLVVAGSPAEATRRQLERLPPHVDVLSTPASDTRDSGQAAAALAERVAVRQERPGLLVLAGGQTARLVCTRLGVRGLRVLGEVLPGIPLGRLSGGPWDDVLVVTKAGGFGGPDALLDALRLLGPS